MSKNIMSIDISSNFMMTGGPTGNTGTKGPKGK